MDQIKIRLSDKAKAKEKGAEYFQFDGLDCVFYDDKGKELWREKTSKKGWCH